MPLKRDSFGRETTGAHLSSKNKAWAGWKTQTIYLGQRRRQVEKDAYTMAGEVGILREPLRWWFSTHGSRLLWETSVSKNTNIMVHYSNKMTVMK